MGSIRAICCLPLATRKILAWRRSINGSNRGHHQKAVFAGPNRAYG